jgi:hypothetical protein
MSSEETSTGGEPPNESGPSTKRPLDSDAAQDAGPSTKKQKEEAEEFEVILLIPSNKAGVLIGKVKTRFFHATSDFGFSQLPGWQHNQSLADRKW